MNNQFVSGGVMNAQPKDAYQSNGLTSEVQELHQCVQDMHHAFEMLYEKVSPLRRPDSPNACGEASADSCTPILSPIEEQVRIARHELNGIRVAMLQLHARIAL